MGSDGARGMKHIRNAGGMTIAQDEKSCIVFGMPKVAIESGCINKILPLDEMSGEILSLVTGGTREKTNAP
jgi:two-component system chemotaxis response regulator CheB